VTRDAVLYLDDMLDHARAAQSFVAGMTLDAFAQDTRSQYALRTLLPTSRPFGCLNLDTN